MASNRNNNNNDLGYWILSLILLFSFPPLGIFLIARKLFGGDKGRNNRAQGRHPYYTQQEQGGVGARTSAPPVQEAAPKSQTTKAKKAPFKKGKTSAEKIIAKLASDGKGLVIGGAICTGIFAFAALTTGVENVWYLYSGDVAWYLEELIPLLCFTGGFGGMLWAGLRKQKKAKNFRKLMNIIGNRQVVSISSLSSAAGMSPAKVRDALDDMIDEGVFPYGFLDYGSDRLILSPDGLYEEVKQEKAPAPAPAASPMDEQDAILAEIKAVNDAVDDEKLSEQIDRIGVITAKILDYQRTHPEKSPQLHSFLSYYLPTTLKILRAYAQLEDQEVAGENISAAMARIEGMMDKVVEGFERQLDLLFQGDAMDITTDVEVLERMLSKDGLSSAGGMQMEF